MSQVAATPPVSTPSARPGSSGGAPSSAAAEGLFADLIDAADTEADGEESSTGGDGTGGADAAVVEAAMAPPPRQGAIWWPPAGDPAAAATEGLAGEAGDPDAASPKQDQAGLPADAEGEGDPALPRPPAGSATTAQPSAVGGMRPAAPPAGQESSPDVSDVPSNASPSPAASKEVPLPSAEVRPAAGSAAAAARPGEAPALPPAQGPAAGKEEMAANVSGAAQVSSGEGQATSSAAKPEIVPPPSLNTAAPPAAGAAAGPAAQAGAASAPAASPPQASRPQPPHIPIEGLAVHIAARARDGARRFEIRLDPPELGRIDVRLDFARDGQLMTRLVVERSETLDLLRRDSASLEKALGDAGLRTDQSNLQFSLRDQPGGRFQDRREAAPPPDLLIVPDEDVAVREAVHRGYSALRGLGRGIDIRI